MKINIKHVQQGIYLIEISGSTDNISPLKSAIDDLLRDGYNKFIIDMSAFDFLGAENLGILVQQIQIVRNRGGDLRFINIQQTVIGIFRYAGFNDESVFASGIKNASQELSQPRASLSENDYGATMQSQTNLQDPYGATIQMPDSPLAKQKVDDPYGSTIQMSKSPLAKEKVNDPYGATIQTGTQNKKNLGALYGETIVKPPSGQLSNEDVYKNTIQNEKPKDQEVKRKSTIRYFKRMYPFCIFPLKVIFSQQKIQDVLSEKVAQVAGQKDIVVKRQKPIVEVIPYFPGCLIVPTRKKVDITPEIAEINFSVTPLAESKKQQGYVEILYNGEVIDTVDNLRYNVGKQTIAKFALYLSIISPVISTSLDALKIDFNEQLPAAIEWLAHITQMCGGKTGFGAVLAGIFLFISLVFYLAKRPKKASPIDKVLPVENQ